MSIQCSLRQIDSEWGVKLARGEVDVRLVTDAAIIREQDASGVLGELLELDQDWDGINFLLTGTNGPSADPPGDAVLGGTEVGEDIGYGPARVHDAQHVKRIAEAFARLDLEECRSRYDGELISSLDRRPGEGFDEPDTYDLLLERIRELISFYRTAAEKAMAVVLWLD